MMLKRLYSLPSRFPTDQVSHSIWLKAACRYTLHPLVASGVMLTWALPAIAQSEPTDPISDHSVAYAVLQSSENVALETEFSIPLSPSSRLSAEAANLETQATVSPLPEIGRPVEASIDNITEADAERLPFSGQDESAELPNEALLTADANDRSPSSPESTPMAQTDVIDRGVDSPSADSSEFYESFEGMPSLFDYVQSPGEEDEDIVLPVSDRDAYRLGPGDVLQIEIFNAPELSTTDGANQYTILNDGTLNLPWVGRVVLAGLNLEAAGAAIASEYSPFLLDPVVTVSLITARPTRIAVVGEVNRPGTYTTGAFATSGAYASGPARAAAAGGVNQQPVGDLRTVIEAIQTAGGITETADVRNIQVQRRQPNRDISVRTINLMALLQEGDLSQDLSLRDGDTVLVPTATSFNAEELQELADASFSPDIITVNVVGEVVTPGSVVVSPNTSLNQAILAAGGFDSNRARKRRVQLIRLNPDGSVTDRSVSIDFSDGLNEDTNPPLRNNDIVVVARSGLTRVVDFLDIIGTAAGTVLNPIRGVIDIVDTIGDMRDREEDNDRDERRLDLQIEQQQQQNDQQNDNDDDDDDDGNIDDDDDIL